MMADDLGGQIAPGFEVSHARDRIMIVTIYCGIGVNSRGKQPTPTMQSVVKPEIPSGKLSVIHRRNLRSAFPSLSGARGEGSAPRSALRGSLRPLPVNVRSSKHKRARPAAILRSMHSANSLPRRDAAISMSSAACSSFIIRVARRTATSTTR